MKGVSKEESDEILGFLYNHIQLPQFRYIHKWLEYDAVLWDNRGGDMPIEFVLDRIIANNDFFYHLL